MRETRNIIFVTLACSILLGILYEFEFIKNSELLFSLVTNLWCGFIVSFITSSCQFYSQRSKIVSGVYSNYLDLYQLFYYTIISERYGRSFDFKSVISTMEDVNQRNIELLSDYHGLFFKEDMTYKNLNPSMELYETFKDVHIGSDCFSSTKFEEISAPIVNRIEKNLKAIDNRKFESDYKRIAAFWDMFLNNKE